MDWIGGTVSVHASTCAEWTRRELRSAGGLGVTRGCNPLSPGPAGKGLQPLVAKERAVQCKQLSFNGLWALSHATMGIWQLDRAD
jgi:hypothetical protein